LSVHIHFMDLTPAECVKPSSYNDALDCKLGWRVWLHFACNKPNIICVQPATESAQDSFELILSGALTPWLPCQGTCVGSLAKVHASAPLPRCMCQLPCQGACVSFLAKVYASALKVRVSPLKRCVRMFVSALRASPLKVCAYVCVSSACITHQNGCVCFPRYMRQPLQSARLHYITHAAGARAFGPVQRGHCAEGAQLGRGGIRLEGHCTEGGNWAEGA